MTWSGSAGPVGRSESSDRGQGLIDAGIRRVPRETKDGRSFVAMFCARTRSVPGLGAKMGPTVEFDLEDKTGEGGGSSTLTKGTPSVRPRHPQSDCRPPARAPVARTTPSTRTLAPTFDPKWMTNFGELCADPGRAWSVGEKPVGNASDPKKIQGSMPTSQARPSISADSGGTESGSGQTPSTLGGQCS